MGISQISTLSTTINSMMKKSKVVTKFPWSLSNLSKNWFTSLEASTIHPTFHISQLKPTLKRKDVLLSCLPTLDHKGEILLVVHKILRSRVVMKKRRPKIKVLVQWEGQDEIDAS